MYLPRHFEQNEPGALHELMRAHPLATLVRMTPAGLAADHVPLLLHAQAGPHGTLRGHVARANPLWQELAGGGEVLAIFHGPQAYVSPSWYPSKAEHGKVVPTWNYAVVHARGRLTVFDDPVWVRALVGTLTASHEAGRRPTWTVDDAPAEFVDQMLRAIVGFEITITSLVGKWKASQNRSAADRTGVMGGLLREHDDASAALVRDSGA